MPLSRQITMSKQALVRSTGDTHDRVKTHFEGVTAHRAVEGIMMVKKPRIKSNEQTERGQTDSSTLLLFLIRTSEKNLSLGNRHR